VALCSWDDIFLNPKSSASKQTDGEWCRSIVMGFPPCDPQAAYDVGIAMSHKPGVSCQLSSDELYKLEQVHWTLQCLHL
jgi:hypothetical protein